MIDPDALDLAESVGWLTDTEAAAILDRARPTIRWWVYKGWLTGRRCADGRLRYALQDLWNAERRGRRGDLSSEITSANM